MIDLYELIGNQRSTYIDLDDGSCLIIEKMKTTNPEQKYLASWHMPFTGPDGGVAISQSEFYMHLYMGKTARIAITAALQERYGDN